MWSLQAGGLYIQVVFGAGLTAYICVASKIKLINKKIFSNIYNGPCILRPPIQSEKCGLKLKVVLRLKDIYIESIRKVSTMGTGQS